MTKLFQPCHSEVAEPQQDRFMHNLVCCPASGSSESINAYPQGNPLSRACSVRKLTHNHELSLDKGRGRFAFTLAEVLITLAIVGIVAAMTIPTLISDYQEKVTVTKMKKMYSTLTQAYNLYRIENGVISTPTWTEEGAKIIFGIFQPYLRIMKDCGVDDQSCMTSFIRKQKTGVEDTNPYHNEYSVILNDGSTISFRGNSYTTYLGVVYYDVNGDAAPNKWGHDLFQFMILSDRILPVGEPHAVISANSNDKFETGCAGSADRGYACAGWVIHKGNMDYLECDDLTWADSKCPN